MRTRATQRDLRFRSTSRGGRRPGAGRPRGPHVSHISRERFAARYPCHVTLKVRPDLPSLRTVRLVRELERSFARGCERGGFRLVHYSLQGDHAHLLVEANGRAALGRGMKSLAARFARAVNRVFDRSGAVLADRYHLHVLRSPSEVRSALRYVLLNHCKHARRRRAAARPDPASSGRFFDGWREKLGPQSGASPVARAHTWLLSRGWRRGGGRISLVDVPGGT
ncbi:MAG: transposase [Deltaproteobacteria bacterium]|nr:transposase [Deltaproteobacteria bacterium]